VAKATRLEAKSAKQAVRAQLRSIRTYSDGSPLRRGLIISGATSFLLLVALVLATIFTPMMAIEKLTLLASSASSRTRSTHR